MQNLSKGHSIRSAATSTPTRTPTPISFNVGYAGCNARKKILQAWLARVTGNPSANYVCGKLSIVKDNKTEKDVLVLAPCGKGSFYVLKVRPDELHEYYQFMNVQFVNGDKVYTDDYGILSKYINIFSGYFVLENCQGCGIKPVFISDQEIIFPTSTGGATQIVTYPTLPVFPTYVEVLPSLTPTRSLKGPTPVSTPTMTPTETLVVLPTDQTQTIAVPTSALYLTLIRLRLEPQKLIQSQDGILFLTIQNLGFPTGKSGWKYSGEVVLKTSNGEVLEEVEFDSDRSSSIRTVQNTRIQAETWEIAVPILFSHSVQDGEVEVFLRPQDYLTYVYPRSVKTPITVLPEPVTFTPLTSMIPESTIQPVTIQTESVKSRPAFCPGASVLILIPVVSIFMYNKRIRRAS